jgi:acetaldehyde dehydrogenase (acetylating)
VTVDSVNIVVGKCCGDNTAQHAGAMYVKKKVRVKYATIVAIIWMSVTASKNRPR